MGVLTLVALSGYLVGSIPVAYILTKLLKNTDIRTLGSGNPGATNVYRSVGKFPGLLTLFLDIAKGLIPTLVVKRYLDLGVDYAMVCGFFCILGHTYTIFLNFRGGKGVATATGVFLAISPVAVVFGFIGFTLTFLISGYVSLSSMVASVVLTTSVILLKEPQSVLATTAFLALFVIYRHKSNIRRLLSGKELKTKL